MLRWIAPVAALALMGCEPSPPPAPGYFDSVNIPQREIDAYRAERLRQLEVPQVVTTLPPQTEAERIASEARAVLTETPRQAQTPQAPVVRGQDTSVEAPRAIDLSPQGITDTNEFSVITEQETIESDARRREIAQANRVEIAPQPLPERSGSANPAAFALATSHPVGERVYGRRGRSNPESAACRKYPVAEEAQRVFLERGGPSTDPLGLDPDGDGYACAWSPEPYRRMASN